MRVYGLCMFIMCMCSLCVFCVCMCVILGCVVVEYTLKDIVYTHALTAGKIPIDVCQRMANCWRFIIADADGCCFVDLRVRTDMMYIIVYVQHIRIRIPYT